MATYFPSSDNQRDAATMLYLRQHLPTSYSETPVLPGNMMMYMNFPSSSGSYSDALAANSQQRNNCTEIPSVRASGSNEPQQEIMSNLNGSRIGEHDFNAWRDGRNEMLLMHHQMGGSTNILHNGQNLQGQGLSLSLGTQIPSGLQMPSSQFQNPTMNFSSFLGPNPSISVESGIRNDSFRDGENSIDRQPRNAECLPNSFHGVNQDPVKADPSPYGMSSIARVIPNSKYLKAAQQLLDEVVNVRKALKQPDSEKNKNKYASRMEDSKYNEGGSKNEAATGDPSNHHDSTGKFFSEPSPAERLELQNKLTKLLSMLDEVDRRYKQYYHQMQIVVSSFDVIAGYGAAKPYTALALQTISRHFRCLRDAITDQIRSTRKSLGEQNTSANSNGVGISRLRYVDQQLKQQRALQQLGMMQQQTWRPQRGLPESSVSVLRAWLFEHFLHPYPKDSDKIMLARQTGLTRSQVSNWFINARVRLWKPMVEEMYKEEAANADMDSNSSSQNAPKARKGVIKASNDRGEDLQQSPTSTATEKCSTGQFINSKSNHVHEIEMEGPSGKDNFQNETHEENGTGYGIVKFRGDQRPNADDCSLNNSGIVQFDGDGDRFMTAAAAAFHIPELERFGSGGGVSLTLGLQHFEGGSLPMAVGNHHGFVTVRGGHIYNPTTSSVGPEAADFDCMNPGNRQHRFGSSHLMHDFVA